jgi:hypothetical protein
MSTPPDRFFAPTYYSPFYFPSLVTDGGAPPPAAPRYRDMDAFGAIVAALTATGEFADVAFGTTLDRWAAGADQTPAAVITPDSWAEVDDVDPVQLVRRVAFLLTLVVRDEDPAARFDALDRLTTVAQNAIDGRDLGGTNLPALTLLRRGRFDPNSQPPEQGVILRGEYTFLIPSMTGHNSSY